MLTTTPVQLSLQNIMVPLDFSPLSESAIRLAGAVAQRHGSKIHLANVIEPFDAQNPSIRRNREPNVGLSLLDFEAIEEKILSGLQHENVILNGELVESLLHETAQRDIDIVVMATHGAAGCERLLMGSNTEEFFRDARCPVLTIGPKAEDDFARFASFKNILYPMEMTSSSKAAIPYLVELTDTCRSQLTLLHVVHPDIQSPSERQRLRKRLNSEMRGLFPERLQTSLTEIIVEFGPVAETIVEFSLANHADVLALGVRSGGPFARSATHIPWSIAHKIIAEAPCPVLTIRGRQQGKHR